MLGNFNLTEAQIKNNIKEILDIGPGKICNADLKTLLDLFSDLYEIDLAVISKAAIVRAAENIMGEAREKGASFDERMKIAIKITGMDEDDLNYWLD